MLYQWRDRCACPLWRIRRCSQRSLPRLASWGQLPRDLPPIAPQQQALTSTTAVPGSNCSATLNGSALNRRLADGPVR